MVLTKVKEGIKLPYAIQKISFKDNRTKREAVKMYSKNKIDVFVVDKKLDEKLNSCYLLGKLEFNKKKSDSYVFKIGSSKTELLLSNLEALLVPITSSNSLSLRRNYFEHILNIFCA